MQLQASEHVVEQLESCREKIRVLGVDKAGESNISLADSANCKKKQPADRLNNTDLSARDAADLEGAPFVDMSFDWDLDCLNPDFFLNPTRVN